MQHLLLVFRDRLDVLEQLSSNPTTNTTRDDSNILIIHYDLPLLGNGKRKISKTNQ